MNDMNRYGPAMILYFRHLKTTMCFVFLCAVINSVLVYLYSEAYKSSQGSQFSTVDSQNILLYLREASLQASLGGYAFGTTRFYEANFTNGYDQINSTVSQLSNEALNVIPIDCEKGVFDNSSEYTHYGLSKRLLTSS